MPADAQPTDASTSDAADAPDTKAQREPRSGPTPGRELARIAVDAALGKKARDVVAMDLRGISGEVDYFVIATGESDIQIKAIVDGVVMGIREQTGERPGHREGRPGQNRWIVLDYFDLAVHVFDAETRAHYDLERLWGDAPMTTASDEAPDIDFLQPGYTAPEPASEPDAASDAEAPEDTEPTVSDDA